MTRKSLELISLGVFHISAFCWAQTDLVKQQAKTVHCGMVSAKGNATVNLTCSGLTRAQAKVLENTIPIELENLIIADQQLRADVRETLAASRGGNVRERALTLADSMMLLLYKKGWGQGRGAPARLPDGLPPFIHEPGPRDSKAYTENWYRTTTIYWQFLYGDQTIQVHEDFAQLLLRDPDFDDFIQQYKKEKEQLNGTGIAPASPVNPEVIRRIADSLRRLENQVKGAPS